MGKATQPKEDRNQKLFELKEQGLTFVALSKYFHITDTRVKQLYYNELKKRGMPLMRDRKMAK